MQNWTQEDSASLGTRRLRWALVICISSVCLTGGGGALLHAQVTPDESEAEPRVDHDAELLRAWFDITERIGNGEPWDVIHRELAVAIEDHGQSEHADRCIGLLASIDATRRTPPLKEPLTEQTRIERLVDALHLSKVNYRMVMASNLYYESVEQFVWEYYLERGVRFEADPAFLLFAKGQAALDPLIGALDDQRATRGVGVRDDGFAKPLVICVCDVALGLIESISGCSFKGRRTDLPLMSEWPKADRAELIQLVQDWRAATRSMTPTEAVLWQIKHGPQSLRINMVDTLLARKQNSAVLSYLEDNYKSDDGIDFQFAGRMVRAGSREPLDHIHRLVTAGKQLDRKTIRLIAHYGDARDFQLLIRLIELGRASDDRTVAELPQIIVDALRSADDRQLILSVPVHVAIVESMSEQWQKLLTETVTFKPFPPILESSILAIQEATHIQFGLKGDSTTSERARACRQIVTWWDESGEGAYGLEQNKPHAPLGIR